MTWRTEAACRGMDPTIFFPDADDLDAVAAAITICRRCPVAEPCRMAAAARGEKTGVWGAWQASSLQKLRRRGTGRCVGCSTEISTRALRCDSCNRAHERAYHREYQRTKTARVNGKMLDAGHGTISRYRSGCRCPACRSVSAESRRRFRGTSCGPVAHRLGKIA